MTGWVILVDQPRDFPNADTPHKVITTSEYLARPRLFAAARPKLINLSRSYAYQSKGYYASLLAEARGHRVVPTVETMLELREAKLYEHALPELEDSLNRCARKAEFQPEGELKLFVCFGLVRGNGAPEGIVRDARFEAFGRLLFDWFRCPALEVTVDTGAVWLSIDRIRMRNATRLANGEAAFFRDALHQHTRRDWRSPKARTTAKFDLAVLYDPNEKMPPSSAASIRHFARIAERHSVDVEPIGRRQLAELAEYDGLFIRETTSIDNHTYRFARRAVQEGMPVIDDPISMIRCTNKVFLMELLGQNRVAMPPTRIVSEPADLERAIDELGLPLVVKIPDGSFSRGVHKVTTAQEFKRVADELLEETDLLLAQKFMPTEFDWRVGVLAGEPLFVCQYRMARGHWQIVKYKSDGTSREGGFKTFDLDQAPPAVIETAVRAARPIGDGFYGVDLKETPDGVVVMEVNDNPNLEHGIEDAVGKDEIWVRLLKWFMARMEG
ncbi:RimK family alpha-L-glutamate ligase [Rhodoplanes elegans]|uniref:RimK family alpha-L-glutamate ligase n=1 Tax=Rhodoplanes elegans TaxID=29408 RepID=A0A327KGR6_9BRAD|nr:RimK family protein [Rhodoplanes elegans]MBK5958657.1 RimK family alpha-L-glutamate ligase [Rhodoplanes elegans]RAI34448.1 RimK family alpha-L-glutamate ligase [Rhodoplanes elegans]